MIFGSFWFFIKAYDLGDAYRFMDPLRENESLLFRMLLFPERIGQRYSLTEESLNRTINHILTTIAPLHTTQMQRNDAALIKAEFLWVSDLLQLACKFGLAFLTEKQAPNNLQRKEFSFTDLSRYMREALATDLMGIIAVFPNLWLQRNRFGGLLDSKQYLERVLQLLQSK
jgi:hypothetical protein